MIEQKQPEALELASVAESADLAGYPTAKKANAYCLCLLEDCADMIRRLHSENESLHAERDRNLNSIRVNNEIINKKLDENETLRTGYAAARLEIESLRSVLREIAEWKSHDIQLAVDHGSNGVRDFYRDKAERALAAQPAGAQQTGAAYAALSDAEIDRIVPALEPVSEDFPVEWALWKDRGRIRNELRASHGQAPAQAAPAAVAGPEKGAAGNAYQTALSIRTAQGWNLGGDKVPVLYTDEINGQQVCRDDVWLCTTAALAAVPTTQPAPQQEAQEQAAVPRFNCWTTNDGDSWFDHPADSQAIYDCLGNDAKVGDEYELTAGWRSVTARYRITEVVGDGEEYEVECISHQQENTAPQPSPVAQLDALDAARYRWLRDSTEWEPFDSAWLNKHDIYGCPTPAMDAAIDAARKEKS